MLNRLPDVENRSPLNEIQPHMHPFEILFDVQKLMDVENVNNISPQAHST